MSETGQTHTNRQRLRGMGRLYKRGAIWWLAYYRHGREYRESSRSPREADARRLLKRRLGEIHSGRFVGPEEERVTFDDLAAGYVLDYELRGLRSLDDAARGHVRRLREFFAGDRAVDITPDRIRAYQGQRRAQGAAAATVNRETSALRRMFNLAVKAGQLSRVPVFPERLEENPPRQGFFERAEYLAMREHLPGSYQDVLDFAYFSGWRRSEITGLTWAEVDSPGGVVRLSPERSKTKAGRVLPLVFSKNGKRHSLPLMDVLQRRLAARRLDCRLVFHCDGQPIGDWRKTWRAACKRAGLPGKLLHDCRRTAVRNLVRAGVPERVAMAITGHKTRSVFDRYNIVSEDDLVSAAHRLATYVEQQPTEPSVTPLAPYRVEGGQKTDNPTFDKLAESA